MCVKLIYSHVVNNHVIRHVNIPTYSTSSENVYINEFVQGQPIYQQPVFYQNQPTLEQVTTVQQQTFQQPNFQQPTFQQPTFQQPFTQGNVGYQGMVNPLNNTPFNF